MLKTKKADHYILRAAATKSLVLGKNYELRRRYNFRIAAAIHCRHLNSEKRGGPKAASRLARRAELSAAIPP
jgi:hypothetical protein